jgi:hypothetical protein
MATRIKLMKLLQEMQGFADMSSRRPQTRRPGLFLLQMRSHIHRTTLSSRKRTLTVEMQDRPDIPNPVKIVHLAGNTHAAPARRAQQVR